MKRKGAVWCNKRGFPLYFGYCPNAKTWNYEIKCLGIDGPCVYPPYRAHSHFASMVVFDNVKKGDSRGKVCLVTLDTRRHNSLQEVYSSIVHESVHVWQTLRNYIGENDPSIEFEAYSIQNISDSLFAAFQMCHKLPALKPKGYYAP